MKPLSLNQARERVGAILFGPTWIGSLTDNEAALRSEHLRPRDVPVLGGTGMVSLLHAEPCSPGDAVKLYKALGRFVWLDAQYTTVDTWLADRGFPVDPKKPIDYRSLRQAIANEQRSRSGKSPKRKTGTKPKEMPRLLEAMKDKIRFGKLTEEALREMPDKELMAQFAGKRERCRAARDKYFALKDLARK